MWKRIGFLLLGVLCFVQPLYAVDRSKFKRCSDLGFCRRNRDSWKNYQYTLLEDTLTFSPEQGLLSAHLKEKDGSLLQLELTTLLAGPIRVRIKELAEQGIDRWVTNDFFHQDPSSLPTQVFSVSKDENKARTTLLLQNAQADTESASSVVIHHSPFKVEYKEGDDVVMTLNDRTLMHYEQQRQATHASDEGSLDDDGSSAVEQEDIDRHQGKTVVDYGEDGLAVYDDGTKEERREDSEEESQRINSRQLQASHDELDGGGSERFGSHTDTKPYGPMSVGVDVSFHNVKHIYGLPEHSTPLSLPTTAGRNKVYKEPYRFYNLDVFEYEMDETMALYGHIPFVMAHNQERTTGFFYANPTETFVDVEQLTESTSFFSSSKPKKNTRWISESGILDLYILPGPSPKAVSQQFAALVGTQQLPPLFALGFHQCRWNYKSQQDVYEVHHKFDELDFPVDVLWLDIEHTDGKRYFTWDSHLFPDSLEMIEDLATKGRKLVTIVDPHLKKDNNYHVYQEASSKGMLIKNHDGRTDFEGWCWPGSSVYPDFTSPTVRAWWASLFSPEKYKGTTLDVYTWNDMNEPSVFNGPEVSMQKDCRSTSNIEHREWHNLYGQYFTRSTYEGQLQRNREHMIETEGGVRRPFVLTRSFFAGSQRYGALWTGDNAAEWAHLRISSPMLLSLNLAGFSFSGADVGGFFGNPSAELFTRWMQAAAFQPFFRSHAHIDSKRREPWVFGDYYLQLNREAVALRYSFLPYIYTLFYRAHRQGWPVMRPLWYEFPSEEEIFAKDDAWMLGDALLVHPVMNEGQTSMVVTLPSGKKEEQEGGGEKQEEGGEKETVWYNILGNGEKLSAGKHTLSVELETIPVFQRGGTVIPRKMRLRRSASLMKHDPYTLYVAPDSNGYAKGELYLDDELTMNFEDKKEYRKVSFELKLNGFLKATVDEEREEGEEEEGSFVIPSDLSTSPFLSTNKLERVVVFNINAPPEFAVLKYESPLSEKDIRMRTRERRDMEERMGLKYTLEHRGPEEVDLYPYELKERNLEFTFDLDAKMLVIKKPNIPVGSRWGIRFAESSLDNMIPDPFFTDQEQ